MDRHAEAIVLLTSEPETARAVSAATMNGSASSERIDSCRDLGALTAWLEAHPTQVALVDLDPRPMEILLELEPLVRRFPATRFVVLCSEFRNDVVLEAMQIGARHCLVKRTLAADLPTVLNRLTRDVAIQGSGQGRLVTVLSAKGGCGSTTIAVNLAAELRLSTKERVMLVDLDLHYGAIASYLGIKPRYSIADVLEQGGKVDQNLITSTASTTTDGLSILASPASVDFAAPRLLRTEHFEYSLPAFKVAFPYTIIEAPRISMDLAAELARSSEVTLIVFELSVIDIRNARQIISALVERRVPRRSVLPVANRYQKRDSIITLKQAEQSLGGTDIVLVSNDFESAQRSINYGEPLAKVKTRSTLRKDIVQLVKLIRDGART